MKLLDRLRRRRERRRPEPGEDYLTSHRWAPPDLDTGPVILRPDGSVTSLAGDPVYGIWHLDEEGDGIPAPEDLRISAPRMDECCPLPTDPDDPFVEGTCGYWLLNPDPGVQAILDLGRVFNPLRFRCPGCGGIVPEGLTFRLMKARSDGTVPHG